jgi:gentisate 1,2-dioxygenase
VLTGRIGAVLGGEEVFGDPGDLIFKPRGQWHTFWNATDEPAVVLEIISPGGLEELFKSFATVTEKIEPAELITMAAKYHCDIDLEATFPLIQRYGLAF